MIKMMADASLPNLTQYFYDQFEITQFVNECDLRKKLSNHTLLLCRSTLKLGTDLLSDYPIDCVATVSSGTDHLPQDYPIKIIDAKGANARAVADYVMTCVAYCQLQSYLTGHQVGIIGVGAAGSAVANRLEQLGFKAILFDPLRAMHDPHFSSCEWQDLMHCDLLCVHANLHDNLPYPSRRLLNFTFLSQLKAGTVIINAARGDIVDEKALLQCPQTLYYCTDVYSNEPQINPDLVAFATLCTPHIAGHSIEAKANALRLVSEKIHQWCGKPVMRSVVAEPKIDLPKLDLSWQKAILAIYDPEKNTLAMQKSQQLSQTFLELRQAHQNRHDFNCYQCPEDHAMLQAALGYRCNI